MKLNDLPKLSAYSKSAKRKGKGVASGNGKTAGRGHKGGKARAGYSPAPCCSGIPFYRRFPIRGFSNAKFKSDYAIINLSDIIALNVDRVDKTVMYKAGLIRDSEILVKILNGEQEIKPVGKSITIIADKISKPASVALTNIGGNFISLLETENKK